MLNNSDIKFIKYIMSYINSSEKFSKLFNHHKQVHSVENLFTALIIKLKLGIPYNNFNYFKIKYKR